MKHFYPDGSALFQDGPAVLHVCQGGLKLFWWLVVAHHLTKTICVWVFFLSPICTYLTWGGTLLMQFKAIRLYHAFHSNFYSPEYTWTFLEQM